MSYLWEILFTKLSTESPSIKADFSVKYKLVNKDEVLLKDECVTYHHYFDIANYEVRKTLFFKNGYLYIMILPSSFQTLYILEARVEPTKGNEFCRVGALCHLHLCIERVGGSDPSDKYNSLMYEVLAEQSVWAVCGRTAGVVCFDTDRDPQTVILDVMPLNSGFLPLPLVRISKYIPAEFAHPGKLNLIIIVIILFK